MCALGSDTSLYFTVHAVCTSHTLSCSLPTAGIHTLSCPPPFSLLSHFLCAPEAAAYTLSGHVHMYVFAISFTISFFSSQYYVPRTSQRKTSFVSASFYCVHAGNNGLHWLYKTNIVNQSRAHAAVLGPQSLTCSPVCFKIMLLSLYVLFSHMTENEPCSLLTERGSTGEHLSILSRGTFERALEC